jgi:hypothetical protein
MKSYLAAASFLLLIASSETLAVAVINGIPSQTDDGVTTDLFDVAQGTIITSSSPLLSSFTAEGTFGSTSPQAVEGFRTIFSDAARPVDFIEFRTPTPIDLTSYRFVLGEDGNGSGNRSATAFRLYASSNAADVLSNQISAASIAQTYTVNYGSPQIAISDSLSVPNVQFFRMEVDRTGSSGPRIFELDGFGTVVPEPSIATIFVLSLCFYICASFRTGRFHGENWLTK